MGIFQVIVSAQRSFLEVLHRPILVGGLCLALGLGTLLLDGTLFHLWGLHRDLAETGLRIDQTRQELKTVQTRIEESRQLDYIERQARDQLDLVQDNELVFLFSDSLESGESSVSYRSP
jgi:cell division protein FtsB